MANIRILSGTESCIDPTILPVTATDIVDHTVWLREVNLSNKSAAAVTATITDRQAVPMAIVGGMEILPGQTVTMQFGPRIAPGGLAWAASVADAVVGYLRWSQ